MPAASPLFALLSFPQIWLALPLAVVADQRRRNAVMGAEFAAVAGVLAGDAVHGLQRLQYSISCRLIRSLLDARSERLGDFRASTPSYDR